MDQLSSTPPPHQLPLPLHAADPPPRLLLGGPRLLPQRVWQNLPHGQRTQVRGTLLRVCQEVVHDGARGA